MAAESEQRPLAQRVFPAVPGRPGGRAVKHHAQVGQVPAGQQRQRSVQQPHRPERVAQPVAGARLDGAPARQHTAAQRVRQLTPQPVLGVRVEPEREEYRRQLEVGAVQHRAGHVCAEHGHPDTGRPRHPEHV